MCILLQTQYCEENFGSLMSSGYTQRYLWSKLHYKKQYVHCGNWSSVTPKKPEKNNVSQSQPSLSPIAEAESQNEEKHTEQITTYRKANLMDMWIKQHRDSLPCWKDGGGCIFYVCDRVSAVVSHCLLRKMVGTC